MQPKNFQFGGGASETVLHPLVAVAMLVAILLILILPRKKAITPYLLAFFTIPLGQVLVVAGVHFQMQQILILIVLARMVAFRVTSTERMFAGRFNSLDWVVVLWTLSAFIIFSLRWMDSQAVVKGLGDLLINLGAYLAVRFMIPNREALSRTIKALAAVCVIQGICMTSELFTGQNVFAFLGAYLPEVREGHIRAQGAMGGLYFGSLAAVAMPLFVWLWIERKSRLVAAFGLAGATAAVFASHASTSWLAFGASILGLAFWPVRRQMKMVRWSIAGILVSLHIVMHGPVWSLIEKIDITGGSSSYHRYMLVDNCIRHFWDWWLLGSKSYGDWGFVMFDVCNQFVLTALRGGILTLILYLMIYQKTFAAIGIARKSLSSNRKEEWLLWCSGSALFATVVSSFGINYVASLMMYLLCLLACISVVTFGEREESLRNAVVMKGSTVLVSSLPEMVQARLNKVKREESQAFLRRHCSCLLDHKEWYDQGI